MSVLTIPCERVTLVILTPDHAELVLAYHLSNREHLAPWEPVREESFYKIEAVRERLATSEASFHDGTRYSFGILDNQTGKVAGTCGFSSIVRGVFMACHLGFSIAAEQEGKGIMFEALRAAITYMFDTVGLHRIMANHLPNNERSAKLLARLGFEREGYAKSYLKIAGKWQDHVLNSLVNGE
jgi:[ribosomal protein S5]-alanine N-acetyltransferase